MVVQLPIIEPKTEIGRINVQTGEIQTINNPIQFSCAFSSVCCVKPQIPVTDFDIKRIEEKGYELDQIIEKAEPVIRFAKNFDAEKNYWIKKKPFDDSCTFLEGNKCSIHEFKPFACRIFPFQLILESDDWAKVVFHKIGLCKSVKRVTEDQAQNSSLLENLRDVILEEDDYRIQYFRLHG